MAKMIKSARGELIDWDLLNVQASAGNNVAPVVDVVNPIEQAARKRMKASMEAAKRMVKQKVQDEDAAKARAVLASLEVGTPVLPVSVEQTTDATESQTSSTYSSKSKSK